MVANIRGYTPNYNFKLVNFDTPRWHTLEYANWSQLDAILLQSGAAPIRGEWQNSTLYLIGDRVFDNITGDLYRCLVEHTSPATGSFSNYRTGFPSHWTLQQPGVPLFRGTWAPGITYAQGDMVVYAPDDAYFLCVVPHTSSPVFATDAINWQMIFDASSVADDAADAAASASAAANSAASASTSANSASLNAANAATSAATAVTSATNAATSETNAATSASAAAASAVSAANAAAALIATSATSNNIALGAHNFTTQAGKQFNAGGFVTIVDNANPTTKYMSAQITSYSGTSLVVNAVNAVGSGTGLTNWTIMVSGKTGEAGIGLVWTGTWSAATNYVVADAVLAPNGSSYICKAAHINQQPPNATYWDLLVQGGGAASIVDDSILPAHLDADTAPKQLLMRDRLNFASREGDTFTGAVVLPIAAPTLNTHASNKKYVDDTVTAAIAGVTATTVPNTPSGTIAANTVQGAINEISGDVTALASATQPVDADLTQVAALSGTGIARRTATTPTWAVGGLVTNAELANITPPSFKGRVTASAGVPEDLTVTQATAMLNIFTVALKGLVPVGDADTTKFLRGDATWQVPAGGSGGGITVSASPPGSPTSGMGWYDLNTGITAIYVNDGTSSQWVQINGIGPAGPTGPAGGVGPTGPAGPTPLAYTVAALADGATPALDASLGNIFTLVAAGDRTIAVPSNPTNGQKIMIRHLASGAIRTLALNTGAGGFRFGTDITGLTATASGKTDYIGAIYNGTDSRWDVVAYAKGY